MKTEIFKDNLEEVTNKSIIGYQWIKSNHKGVIVEFGRDIFIGIGVDLSAVGKWSTNSKKQYCEKALSKNGEGGARIFAFDKVKDLYLWLGNPN